MMLSGHQWKAQLGQPITTFIYHAVVCHRTWSALSLHTAL